MQRDQAEPVQVECPQCRYTSIIYIPVEQMPRCPECGITMVIRELLDEGKSA